MSSEAVATFQALNQAAMDANAQACAVLDAKEDLSKPLEGAERQSYEEHNDRALQLMQERETARQRVEAEKAREAAEAEFANQPRGDDPPSSGATLSDLMKSFGKHDKGFIDLADVAVRSEKVGQMSVNRFAAVPADFGSEGRYDEDLGEGHDIKLLGGVNTGGRVMLHQEGGRKHRTEELNLDTSTTGVGASFETHVAPLMALMFEGAPLARLGTPMPFPDLNKATFSVRTKLPSLVGNDVSKFDGVGGTDGANTNANSIMQAISAGNGLAALGEGKEIPEARQTFREVELEYSKWGSILPLTWEVTQRVSGWNVETVLANDIEALGDIAVGHLLMLGTGSGSTHTTPEGLRTELIKAANDTRRVQGVVGTQSGSARTGDNRFEPFWWNLQEMQHKGLVSSYARSSRAVYLANWASCGSIMRCRDDDNNPVFIADPTGMVPGHVFGKPVVPDDSLPDLGNAVKGPILFGDMAGYVFSPRGAARLDYSWEDGFRSDTMSWRFIVCFDGRLAIPEGFTRYDCADV